MNEIVKNSLCEVFMDYGGYGTGFLCKIKYPNQNNEINSLLTNNHVITEYMLKHKEYIEIKLDNDIKKISLNIKRRIWSNENIDFTCIEIFKEDNINVNNLFEIDDNSYDDNYDIKEYDKRGICNSSIGLTKEIFIGLGAIFYCKKYKDTYFFHNLNTESGY